MMSKPKTLRPNAEIFIRALLTNKPVRYRDYTYKVVKAGDPMEFPSGIYKSDHDILVMLGTMTIGNNEQPVVLGCDLSFNDILRMCADMTEEERFEITGNSVLQSFNTR